MRLDHLSDHGYFFAYKDYFYCWEDHGDLLSIPGGKTICYKQQLLEILSMLEPQGLPPLGTLLLAIIATRAGNPDMLIRVKELMHVAEFTPTMETKAFGLLTTLSQMPEEYMTGNKRLQLFQMIFEKAHNLIGARNAKRIIRDFKFCDAFHPVFTTLQQQKKSLLANADLRPLELLADRFPTVESILEKMASVPALPDLPFEPEDPETEAIAPKTFIEQLVQRPETFHIGALIPRIWSGLSIPFHSTHPTPQPLGGVSDLSNKGSLDRLLISEFAHDDLLFLSRLANGEALYINRETPPETNKLQRILLIDSSLQTWGTPRTLAYAVAVAIAHHPKTDIDCTAFAVGNKYTPVYLSSVHELITSLAILDASLHAATGTTDYLKQGLPDSRHEVFFITSPDGLRQSAVQKMLSDYNKELSYTITLSDQGQFTVYKKSGTGMKLLQQFSLPLAQLWQGPPKTTTLKPAVVTPAPLSTYPILFPPPAGIRKVMKTSDGHVFLVTEEHGLFRTTTLSTDRNHSGWIKILGGIPANCDYEIGWTDAGNCLFLYYVNGKKEVHIHNLTTGCIVKGAFNKRRVWHKYPRFFFDDDFFMIDFEAYWEFSFAYGPDTTPRLVITEHKAADTKVWEEAYQARVDELRKAERFVKGLTPDFDARITLPPRHLLRPGFSGHSLRRMKSTCIGRNGSIYINHHVLLLEAEQLRLASGYSDRKEFVATIYKNVATFPDGSTITLDRDGMLILRSSKEGLDDIYIPSALDTGLGMSNRKYYAGNRFYRPEDVQESQIITSKDFYNRFIIDFIVQINLHAAQA